MGLNKNYLCKSILHLASTALLTTLTSISICNAESMKQSLEETVHKNPEILAEKAASESKGHGIDIARGGYLPSLNVQAGGGFEHTRRKITATSCSGRNVCRENRWRGDPEATLRQPIFDGFRVLSEIDRAKSEKTQADRKVDEVAETTAFRTADAYITVRRFQRLLKLAEENAQEHRKILAKINALISGGRATLADRFTVESRLHDAESAIVDIQGDLGTAIANYIDVVGKEPGALDSAKFPEELLPKTLEEALQVAARQNRSVILSHATLQVAKAELDGTKALFWPTVDAEVRGRREENTSGRAHFEHNVTAMAILRYNILNGGSDLARKKAAIQTVVENRHRRELARSTAEREVRVSWSELQSARKQAASLRSSVEAKNKVQEFFVQQFELGTRSLVDLLDAKNEYFLAKGSLITIDATEDLTSARLLAAMGVFLQRFGLAGESPAVDHSAPIEGFEEPEAPALQPVSYTPETSAEVPPVVEPTLQPAEASLEPEKSAPPLNDQPAVASATVDPVLQETPAPQETTVAPGAEEDVPLATPNKTFAPHLKVEEFEQGVEIPSEILSGQEF